MSSVAAIWTPKIASSHRQKLEARRNEALRYATVCVKTTAVNRLRKEIQCIPLKDHCHNLAT